MKRLIIETFIQRPRKTGKDSLVLVLLLIMILPLVILMLILMSIFILYQYTKWKFWAKKQSSVISPMGIMINQNGRWQLVMWGQIEKAELWLKKGAEVTVLKLKRGEDVLLPDVNTDALKQALVVRGISFHDQIVVVN